MRGDSPINGDTGAMSEEYDSNRTYSSHSPEGAPPLPLPSALRIVLHYIVFSCVLTMGVFGNTMQFLAVHIEISNATSRASTLG